MQKENLQISQDKKLLDLVPNFLDSFSYADAEVISNLHKFFRDEYIYLSHNKEFEQDYRIKWLDNITYLENLARPFKGYNREEIEMAFTIGFTVLDANRTKQLTKKESEVSNA